MYVVGLLEFALEICVDDGDDRDPLLWDEAFAIYAGSLEGSDGSGDGKLLYHLADEMCIAFGTCVLQSAPANRKLVEEFQTGQSRILSGQCEDATSSKDRIVSLMTVPLIQGLLLSATGLQEADTVGQVTAFIFATSVLPLLHDCNETAAALIYDAFRLPITETDEDLFPSIRAVVESSYECLGISCEDIGFLLGADLCLARTEAPTTSAGSDGCEDDAEEEDCGSGSNAAVPSWAFSILASFLLWIWNLERIHT
jgi:hypothetical protein